jgi:DNA-binding MltR family transcriptional regulator
MAISNTLAGDDFDSFADDLLVERVPRSLIIIGASKVDDLLLQVLAQYLIPKNSKPKDNDELLEGDRPLATFSARIKLTYRLGLIDETLYRALEQLRALRNKCAHSVNFNVATSPASEHLHELRKGMTARPSYTLTRKRYFAADQLSGIEELQCALLNMCVLLEGVRRQTPRTNGGKRTRTIASG